MNALKQSKNSFKGGDEPQSSPYIQQLMGYYGLFQDVPPVKYLIDNVLLSEDLLKQNLLPHLLPKLVLPNDIQDRLFIKINATYPKGDLAGDRLWDQYNASLPQLDKLLRSYRDYLEETYGLWSYTNSSFAAALTNYLKGAPVLEVMAGNGYISRGLRERCPNEKVITTDSGAWLNENQTGHHPVTAIEPLDALSALKKYGNQVEYVIMAWAPDKGKADLNLLRLLRSHYPKLRLLIIGEKNGATNSSAFWQTVRLSQNGLGYVNDNLRSFDLIDEQIYLAK